MTPEDAKLIGKALRAMARSNNAAEILGGAFALENVLIVAKMSMDEFARWVESWAAYEADIKERAESHADEIMDEVFKSDS
jgi:hypothetical protein